MWKLDTCHLICLIVVLLSIVNLTTIVTCTTQGGSLSIVVQNIVEHNHESTSEQEFKLLTNKIIHLPPSIFTNLLQFSDDYSNDSFLGRYMQLIAVVVIVLALSLIVLPTIVSCGALWIFYCCLYPDSSTVLLENEEEELDEHLDNIPKINLDSGWYTRIQNRLFDITFVDCAIILFWVVTWIFRKLTCGIFDSIFVLRLTRFKVRRMVIGNRKLDMDISDAFCTIPLIHYLNSFCNIYTCGLWRALGLTHRFYLSKIDKRIFWKPLVEDMDTNRRVVWHNFSDNRSFKWFSVYCGAQTELTYWLLKVLNISTLFILGPFIHAWYIKQKVLCSRFGGRGSFAVYNNGNLEGFVMNSPNVVRFLSHLDGCSLLVRIWMFRILNILTFGIFGCITGESFILGFIDEHLTMIVV